MCGARWLYHCVSGAGAGGGRGEEGDLEFVCWGCSPHCNRQGNQFCTEIGSLRMLFLSASHKREPSFKYFSHTMIHCYFLPASHTLIPFISLQAKSNNRCLVRFLCEHSICMRCKNVCLPCFHMPPSIIYAQNVQQRCEACIYNVDTMISLSIRRFITYAFHNYMVQKT